MTRTRADLESIHRYCSRHRDLLARSELAGCFYCEAMFHSAEIMDWVDGPNPDSTELDDGITALCPSCGIDAVLPSAAPINLSRELLREMKVFFFET